MREQADAVEVAEERREEVGTVLADVAADLVDDAWFDAARVLALELLNWSDDVVLCTDGAGRISREDRARLARNGIEVIEDRVRAFTGDDLGLRAIAFETRPPLSRGAVFFSLGQRQASPLAERLGCRMNLKGTVDTARHESTNVPGVYVVGDASHNLQWVALAAAEGAEAAFAIVQAFLDARLQ